MNITIHYKLKRGQKIHKCTRSGSNPGDTDFIIIISPNRHGGKHTEAGKKNLHSDSAASRCSYQVKVCCCFVIPDMPKLLEQNTSTLLRNLTKALKKCSLN